MNYQAIIDRLNQEEKEFKGKHSNSYYCANCQRFDTKACWLVSFKPSWTPIMDTQEVIGCNHGLKRIGEDENGKTNS